MLPIAIIYDESYLAQSDFRHLPDDQRVARARGLSWTVFLPEEVIDRIRRRELSTEEQPYARAAANRVTDLLERGCRGPRQRTLRMDIETVVAAPDDTDAQGGSKYGAGVVAFADLLATEGGQAAPHRPWLPPNTP